ncbi:MAG: hypothetical protein JRE40_14040 [Deltaproteobacteria bacterium]|nr:hypothetical protein [Deltaproteobacteria bacterium]
MLKNSETLSETAKVCDWRKRNPFTDEFLEKEVKWYGSHEGLNYITPGGRQVDDYLNVNFRPEPDFEVPVLIRDNRLWMSLTWMEAQSMWLPILKARGRAATVGLGLGYFALRVAEKPEVTSLTVFEINQEIVDWFRSQFSGRPGFEKIEFVVGDARDVCIGYEFDTMFVDCYPLMAGDECVEDIDLFKRNNDIGDYRFWGYERNLADAWEHHYIFDRGDMNDDHLLFFEYWEKTKLSNLRRDVFDVDYTTNVIEAMEWDI